MVLRAWAWIWSVKNGEKTEVRVEWLKISSILIYVLSVELDFNWAMSKILSPVIIACGFPPFVHTS